MLKQGPREQVTQVCVHMAFECVLDRRLHSLSEQPVPVLSDPHSTVLPHVQVEFPVLQFVPIASCPIAQHRWEEPVSILLAPPFR